MGRVLAAFLLFALIPCAYAETDPGTATYLKKTATASADKMDKVIANQEEILKQLKEIKNELYVIKIRATR